MPLTIWKFPFNIDTEVEIEMPAGAKVLHVDAQRDVPCMWALVNPDARKETRRFAVRGTGHAIPHGGARTWAHLGSFLMLSESLVFHVFEISGVAQGVSEVVS